MRLWRLQKVQRWTTPAADQTRSTQKHSLSTKEPAPHAHCRPLSMAHTKPPTGRSPPCATASPLVPHHFAKVKPVDPRSPYRSHTQRTVRSQTGLRRTVRVVDTSLRRHQYVPTPRNTPSANQPKNIRTHCIQGEGQPEDAHDRPLIAARCSCEPCADRVEP